MRSLAFVAACALLVPANGQGASTPAFDFHWLLVPDRAPAEGKALAFRVSVHAPGQSQVELRDWLDGPGVQGGQAWTGAAWARSDRYQVRWTLDAAGSADGWLAVRASSLGEGPLQLHVRARDMADNVLGDATHSLALPAESRDFREGLAPGTAAVAAWDAGRLLAVAPVHPFIGAEAPWDVDGYFVLNAPARAELRALDADGRDRGPLAGDEPAGRLAIVSLLPDPPASQDAEFIRVGNAGGSPVSLAGWTLQGHGWRAVFHGGDLHPGETVALTRNASAYHMLTGASDASDAIEIVGKFGLPKEAGAVELDWLHRPRDTVVWGAANGSDGWRGPPLLAPAPGQLLRRAPAWLDSDRAEDWDPAWWSASWSPREPLRANASVTLLDREDAKAGLTRALAEAEHEVWLEVYEFTHAGLSAALHDLLARHVRVHVLVEGAPVGGIPRAEQALLDRLAGAGADVLRIGGSGRDRYAVVHAKVLVIDQAAIVLGSENWTPSGFSDSGDGNLGWSAWVRSPELAVFFRETWEMDADLARGDVARWKTREAHEVPNATFVREGSTMVRATAASANVTALLVPENAAPNFLAWLSRAERTIDLEALQMPWTWKSGTSPVVKALQGAAVRGVAVRVLLDGAPGGENEATQAALSAWASEHAASLEARLSASSRVHNKGVVLDGREVWVGSMNFAEASMTRNREAALLIEGKAASDAATLFGQDWQATHAPPLSAQTEPTMWALPLAGLVALGAWRSRRRGRGGR